MGTEVSGIAGLFVNAGKSAATTNKNAQVEGDFSAFMNLNSYHQNRFTSTYAVSQDNAKNGIDSANDKNVSYDKYQYQKSPVIKSAAGKTYTKEELKAVEEKVTEFSQNITAVLTDKLSVSEEDILNAMETLQLSFMDFMDPQNLVALLGELTGCENPMQLLMADSFQSVFTAVEEVTNQLLDALGMTKDEFLNACETMLAQTAEDVAAQDETVAAEDAVPAENITAEGKTEIKEETVTTEQKDSKGTAEEITPVAEQQTMASKKVETEQQTAEEPERTNESVEEEPEMLAQENAKEQSEGSEMTSQDNDTNNLLKKSKTTVFETKTPSGEGTFFHTKTQPVVTVDGNVTVSSVPYTNISDMVEQISEYTRVIISQGRNSLEMQLNPENLGKIYIHVSEKAGAITAQITASNESVREALQAQVVNLKESLNQQGIKVEAVEVTIESHEFEQNLEENAKREQNNAEQNEKNAAKARRNINLNDLDALSNILSEEEDLVAKMMQENGNQMDVIV